MGFEDVRPGKRNRLRLWSKCEGLLEYPVRVLVKRDSVWALHFHEFRRHVQRIAVRPVAARVRGFCRSEHRSEAPKKQDLVFWRKCIELSKDKFK